VREDESGDSEDGEDDELPCAIGGESEGDSVLHLALGFNWFKCECDCSLHCDCPVFYSATCFTCTWE